MSKGAYVRGFNNVFAGTAVYEVGPGTYNSWKVLQAHASLVADGNAANRKINFEVFRSGVAPSTARVEGSLCVATETKTLALTPAWSADGGAKLDDAVVACLPAYIPQGGSFKFSVENGLAGDACTISVILEESPV